MKTDTKGILLGTVGNGLMTWMMIWNYNNYGIWDYFTVGSIKLFITSFGGLI